MVPWTPQDEEEAASTSSMRSDAVPGEPSVISFLLQVTPKKPLNAPATPDQDPAQLCRPQLHSQLLDPGGERLKAHAPPLGRAEIAAANDSGAGTAATVTATALPPLCRLPQGFGAIFQCLLRERCLLLGAALAAQRSSNRSLWQKAPGHPNGSRALPSLDST